MVILLHLREEILWKSEWLSCSIMYLGKAHLKSTLKIGAVFHKHFATAAILRKFDFCIVQVVSAANRLTLDKMDERGWLVFTLFSFFTFVGISYVRESKLVFLVEKYSKQVESLQNVTVASKTDSLVGHISGKPVNERGMNINIK